MALDVGATRIKGALVTGDGSRLVELRRPTRRSDGPQAVISRVTEVATELMAMAGTTEVLAGGIAVCGTVDAAGRVTAVNLGWARLALASVIGGRLGVPVAVVNDAYAGAVGEGILGAAQGVRDYLYVSLGTGIGAAIVHDGRVLGGAHGHAGELGHIRVERPGRPCACGSRGCLQTVMSAAALEARWAEAHGTPLPARQIIDRVASGDQAARALWDEAIDALVTGLLTVMSLLDPAVIVLGGGLSGVGSHLTSSLARSISAQAPSFHIVAELRLAALGDWSGCAGAAAEARSLIS